MKQATLKSKDTVMTAWLYGEDFQKGSRLTLKNDDRLWEVVEVYECEKVKGELNRGWNAGGLV